MLFGGIDPTLPLFAFIFLVALGVITSAGIVLAGTFGILGVLPLVPLTQIGFTVAFGVLLDTFIVRSVLVPALVVDVGKRTWWPSRLARGKADADVPETRPDRAGIEEGALAGAGAER
ncbi:MAG: MMPL family transporter [Thermoleophilaceae bacterium]|nr:MMPL family transporter [Thermoleophilaceae bacterium]